jgi:hypothetical protein
LGVGLGAGRLVARVLLRPAVAGSVGGGGLAVDEDRDELFAVRAGGGG